MRNCQVYQIDPFTVFRYQCGSQTGWRADWNRASNHPLCVPADFQPEQHRRITGATSNHCPWIQVGATSLGHKSGSSIYNDLVSFSDILLNCCLNRYVFVCSRHYLNQANRTWRIVDLHFLVRMDATHTESKN